MQTVEMEKKTTAPVANVCQVGWPRNFSSALLPLAFLSAGLLWLCHFPVAWGWLGWVALVPLMPLIRAESTARWRYFCAWIAGTAFFWSVISWMTVADTRMIGCWALLSFYCALYFPLGIFLARLLDRKTGLPLVLSFPAVWVGLEFVRCFLMTGFPWYLLAHTQHNVLQVIQIADLGGAFAVSFVVAALNVVVFEALSLVLPLAAKQAGCEKRCYKGFAMQLGFVALLVAGTLAYGSSCLAHTDFDKGPRIALLQGNVDQRLRTDAERSAAAQAKVRAAYLDLSIQAGKLKPCPDLIVWPETSYPVGWIAYAPGFDSAELKFNDRHLDSLQREAVSMVGSLSNTNVLVGLSTKVKDTGGKERRYNSALLIDVQGNAVMRYDKIHRVPFGEYLPLLDWLPFMKIFSPYDHDYSIRSGDGLTRFTLGDHRFGVVVCYEDSDPFMAREYSIATADGPPVDFLLNISNDGWFDGSAEHEEHLAISRFRAIESRRALARAVNMGISAVIDGNGRVLAPVKQTTVSSGPHEVWTIPDDKNARHDLDSGDWRQYKQTEGILVVDMPIDRRASFYAAYGDWLPYSCWILIGGGLAWGWWNRRSVHRSLMQNAA